MITKWIGGAVALAVACLTTDPAAAQCSFDSMSDGSDGSLAVTEDMVIDLSGAVPGNWDDRGDGTGTGIYDAARWVVVFKYEDVSVPPGTSVSFMNHPSGAPVVWLVVGDVVIEGTVIVNGQNGFNAGPAFEFATPGPGGFAGGARGPYPPGAGFGPSAGVNAGAHGGPSATPFPLIGGSGGAAGVISNLGGAGGGAILIASTGTIQIPVGGSIQAIGGGGGQAAGSGSGGMIRLVADIIEGSGALLAYGGGCCAPGFGGAIRLEACDHSGFTGSPDPPETRSGPGQLLQDDTTPTLEVTHINGQPVTDDPKAGPLTTEVVSDTLSVVLAIGSTNVPEGTTVDIVISPTHGNGFTTQTVLGKNGTAEVVIVLPGSFPADIQLRASW